MANTLLLAAAGRAADLRLIRMAGATRRQVIWLVTAESALVVAIGALLGGVSRSSVCSASGPASPSRWALPSTWWCRGRWWPGGGAVPAARGAGRRAADVAVAAAPSRPVTCRPRRMTAPPRGPSGRYRPRMRSARPVGLLSPPPPSCSGRTA
ncbi:hypothetical protein NKG94_28045 [Micromonospora sp. M12]